MEFGRLPSEKRQVNLTPLIDMMFLLVIFFMLTTSFGLTNLIDINLKGEDGAAASALPEKPKNPEPPFRIGIELPDRILINGEEISKAELDNELSKALKDHPQREVAVKTGEGVKVQDLVALLDHLAVFGGGNVSLAEGQ